ncbi:hypothetical protein [Nocardia sp. NPDC049149]|uniref:hypothetical protein n=1 Tax=Nocardia sp. NPDC049149 TaxID=3364315 RepID=UPI003718BB3C
MASTAQQLRAEIPIPVQEMVFGRAFPEGDPERMRRAAQAWRVRGELYADLRRKAEAVQVHTAAALSESSRAGASVAAYASALREDLAQAAEFCAGKARQLEQNALSVEKAQWEMTVFAVAVMYQLLCAGGWGGIAGIGVATQARERFLAMLGKLVATVGSESAAAAVRFALRALGFGALQAGVDVAVQLAQGDHRDELDGESIMLAALAGVGAGVGGMVGARLATNASAAQTSWGRLFVAGAAGASGVLGGAGAVSLATGEFQVHGAQLLGGAAIGMAVGARASADSAPRPPAAPEPRRSAAPEPSAAPEESLAVPDSPRDLVKASTQQRDTPQFSNPPDLLATLSRMAERASMDALWRSDAVEIVGPGGLGGRGGADGSRPPDGTSVRGSDGGSLAAGAVPGGGDGSTMPGSGGGDGVVFPSPVGGEGISPPRSQPTGGGGAGPAPARFQVWRTEYSGAGNLDVHGPRSTPDPGSFGPNDGPAMSGHPSMSGRWESGPGAPVHDGSTSRPAVLELPRPQPESVVVHDVSPQRPMTSEPGEPSAMRPDTDHSTSRPRSAADSRDDGPIAAPAVSETGTGRSAGTQASGSGTGTPVAAPAVSETGTGRGAGTQVSGPGTGPPSAATTTAPPMAIVPVLPVQPDPESPGAPHDPTLDKPELDPMGKPGEIRQPGRIDDPTEIGDVREPLPPVGDVPSSAPPAVPPISITMDAESDAPQDGPADDRPAADADAAGRDGHSDSESGEPSDAGALPLFPIGGAAPDEATELGDDTHTLYRVVSEEYAQVKQTVTALAPLFGIESVELAELEGIHAQLFGRYAAMAAGLGVDFEDVLDTALVEQIEQRRIDAPETTDTGRDLVLVRVLLDSIADLAIIQPLAEGLDRILRELREARHLRAYAKRQLELARMRVPDLAGEGPITPQEHLERVRALRDATRARLTELLPMGALRDQLHDVWRAPSRYPTAVAAAGLQYLQLDEFVLAAEELTACEAWSRDLAQATAHFDGRAARLVAEEDSITDLWGEIADLSRELNIGDVRPGTTALDDLLQEIAAMRASDAADPRSEQREQLEALASRIEDVQLFRAESVGPWVELTNEVGESVARLDYRGELGSGLRAVLDTSTLASRQLARAITQRLSDFDDAQAILRDALHPSRAMLAEQLSRVRNTLFEALRAAGATGIRPEMLNDGDTVFQLVRDTQERSGDSPEVSEAWDSFIPVFNVVQFLREYDLAEGRRQTIGWVGGQLKSVYSDYERAVAQRSQSIDASRSSFLRMFVHVERLETIAASIARMGAAATEATMDMERLRYIGTKHGLRFTGLRADPGTWLRTETLLESIRRRLQFALGVDPELLSDEELVDRGQAARFGRHTGAYTGDDGAQARVDPSWQPVSDASLDTTDTDLAQVWEKVKSAIVPSLVGDFRELRLIAEWRTAVQEREQIRRRAEELDAGLSDLAARPADSHSASDPMLASLGDVSAPRSDLLALRAEVADIRDRATSLVITEGAAVGVRSIWDLAPESDTSQRLARLRAHAASEIARRWPVDADQVTAEWVDEQLSIERAEPDSTASKTLALFRAVDSMITAGERFHRVRSWAGAIDALDSKLGQIRIWKDLAGNLDERNVWAARWREVEELARGLDSVARRRQLALRDKAATDAQLHELGATNGIAKSEYVGRDGLRVEPLHRMRSVEHDLLVRELARLGRTDTRELSPRRVQLTVERLRRLLQDQPTPSALAALDRAQRVQRIDEMISLVGTSNSLATEIEGVEQDLADGFARVSEVPDGQ